MTKYVGMRIFDDCIEYARVNRSIIKYIVQPIIKYIPTCKIEI